MVPRCSGLSNESFFDILVSKQVRIPWSIFGSTYRSIDSTTESGFVQKPMRNFVGWRSLIFVVVIATHLLFSKRVSALSTFFRQSLNGGRRSSRVSKTTVSAFGMGGSFSFQRPDRLEIRSVDPSDAPGIGSTVVANSDLASWQIYQFQSLTVQDIYDMAPHTQEGTTRKIPVTKLDQPKQDAAHVRFVTLGRPRSSSLTMRLAGIYSHGLSSLWILENPM